MAAATATTGPAAAAAAAAAAAGAATASYPMASLYVGDLHTDVSEAMLFEKFSQAGPVLSIRVCRDAITRRSLGYAYVNFQQPADAERALDTMNFDVLMGRPMRIMWSQRDPAMRRSGHSNIFIKNLDKAIDNKSIYDTFSLFGNILSCKVATDDESSSKGYGFVHFETEEAANKAIASVNGMLLAGKKVFVGKFVPRATRMKEMGESARRFTNVYVKGFDDKLDQAKLEELFGKFGKVTSCVAMTDGEGKSKGFGFVAFENAEDAEKAVNELHESEIPESDGKKLYVSRAQKKSERSAELRRKFELQKAERSQRYQGVNLYVKNLDDTVDDEALRQHFEPFGKITSAKVMLDEHNRSKGFGFVCFEKPDEATKAVTELNTRMMCNKPLYVALAQRKEDRRAQLASQYMQRLAQMRMQASATAGGMGPGGPAAAMYTAGQGGYFVSGLPRAAPAGFMGGIPAMRQAAVSAARGPANVQSWVSPAAAAGYAMQGAAAYPFPQTTMYGGRGGSRPIAGGPQPRGGYANPMQPRPPMGAPAGVRGPQLNPARANLPAGVVPGGVKPQGSYVGGYPAGAGGRPVQVPGQPGQQPAAGQQQMNVVLAGQEPLTTHMLSQAAPQEQKQMLGERIYALIDHMYKGRSDAGKITGMMLEMDNSELIMMLQDTELFRSKVQEALDVLAKSQTTGGAGAAANGGQA